MQRIEIWLISLFSSEQPTLWNTMKHPSSSSRLMPLTRYSNKTLTRSVLLPASWIILRSGLMQSTIIGLRFKIHFRQWISNSFLGQLTTVSLEVTVFDLPRVAKLSRNLSPGSKRLSTQCLPRTQLSMWSSIRCLASSVKLQNGSRTIVNPIKVLHSGLSITPRLLLSLWGSSVKSKYSCISLSRTARSSKKKPKKPRSNSTTNCSKGSSTRSASY